MLQDQIQKTHNRIQYDRTLDEGDILNLRCELHSLETEFEDLFGEAAV